MAKCPICGKDGYEEEGDIDKDNMTYRSTMLALDILSLPEVKNANPDSITFDQWLKWSRKVKNKRKNVQYR